MGDDFLSGKVAMVTGGASGMGRAMATAFAKAGADVAIGSLVANSKSQITDGELVYKPSMQDLEKTKADLRSHGIRAIARDLDVCSTQSVESFYDETVKALGKVDILANAAGVSAEQTMRDHPHELWSKVMDVNVNGVFRSIRVCLPGMIARRWGRIINIGSTAASVGAPTSGAYCASKAAVVGLTRCVALEGAAHGVSCNVISPGWVETRFGKRWMTHIAETVEKRTAEEYIRETQQSNPQGRMIQPEEIGSLAAFLCREDAFGITMQDLTVSAGSLW